MPNPPVTDHPPRSSGASGGPSSEAGATGRADPVCVCGHPLSGHDTDLDCCRWPGCPCGEDLDGFEAADLDPG
jgi:hypothetical protein